MHSHGDRARGLFACLGEASRYRIVATLSAGERCVSDLAREVALSQSCTTRHLQALERVGLVAGVRQGKRVVFRLRTDDPRVGGLLEWIRSDALVEPGAHAVPERGARAHTGRSGVDGVSRANPWPRTAEGSPGSAKEPTPARGPAPQQDEGPGDPVRPTPGRQDLEDFLL
jgi:DNA-binding transcriptional ArsR family regulator